ncbi:hypothetical protein Tco_0259581, partial [Tanacetum coccineum]
MASLFRTLPGPDDYTFAFVKKYWDMLKVDILGFVNSFLSSRKMPLALILRSFLAFLRLSKVMDKIVSHEQTAFIANRQILDGPLILSEAIDWYKKKKKKMLIFKVDFEKAFDSVSW